MGLSGCVCVGGVWVGVCAVVAAVLFTCRHAVTAVVGAGMLFSFLRRSHSKFPLLIRTHHVPPPSPSACCCCAVPAAEQEADDSGSDSDGR